MGSPDDPAGPHDPADLERAWGRALYRWWSYYDREYLHAAMQRPLIHLGDGAQRLGEWDPGMRRITISRQHIRTDPWADVLDSGDPREHARAALRLATLRLGAGP